MDHVDLIFALAMILVLSCVAWFVTFFFTNWKEDAIRGGAVNFDHADQQKPRAVSWEEFNQLREKVTELEKRSCADHNTNQEMAEAILQLDRKIGNRYCIRWTERFISFDTMVHESYEQEFVWSNRFDMTSSEASDTMKRIMKESTTTYKLVEVRDGMLVTSCPKIEKYKGITTQTYKVEEVKI